MSRNRLFESIKIRPPRKNVFDLSHEKKLSMNMGDIVPIMLQEVIPGDHVFCKGTETLIRLAPMIAPIMHRCNAYIHYFFVPHRLVWDNWKTFITGGVTGKLQPEFPYMLIDDSQKQNYQKGSLGDYFGIPIPPASGTTVTSALKVSALPFRGYSLIYNEYYRDQTLTPEVPIDKTDGPPTQSSQCDLRKRSWEKDYFTSALPFTQRGDEVMLPNTITYKSPADLVPTIAGQVQDGALSAKSGHMQSSAQQDLLIENIEELAVTINDLRTSARLQEYLEKMARAGSRYVEQILAIFGVVSDDLQQNRPSYLGGSVEPITISEVLAHFGSTDIPQGNMAGHGLSVGSGNGFKAYFKEHGYIFGLLSVLPRTAYDQGLDRTFIKNSKFDFFTPDFAHLGEQPVYNAELYHDYLTSGTPYNTFGYQSRYAEYKFQKSTIHGDFHDNLNFWHMGRQFSAPPQLNASFVEADPTQRIFAVEDPAAHHLYVQLYNNIKAIRPIPVFGTPKL